MQLYRADEENIIIAYVDTALKVLTAFVVNKKDLKMSIKIFFCFLATTVSRMQSSSLWLTALLLSSLPPSFTPSLASVQQSSLMPVSTGMCETYYIYVFFLLIKIKALNILAGCLFSPSLRTMLM